MRIRNLTGHKCGECSSLQFHNSHKFSALYFTVTKDECEKGLYYSINNNKHILLGKSFGISFLCFRKKFKILSLICFPACLLIIIQVMTVILSKTKPENLGSTLTFLFLETLVLPHIIYLAH